MREFVFGLLRNRASFDQVVRTKMRLAPTIGLAFLCLFLGLLSPQLCAAATYYVATNGNNSNPGTIGSPFLTIAKGLSVLAAGDTLYIRAGTYAEYIDNNVPSGTSFTNAVTVSGFPSEVVTIRPNSGNDHVINFNGSGPSYIIFNNLVIDATNAGHNGMKLQGGPNHIRVQNCEFKNAVESGILLTDGSGFNEFINVNSHNNGQIGYAPPVAAYGMYIATANNLVDRCSIHDNVGYGIHTYSATGGADNITIRNTRIYNNGRNTSNYVFGVLVGPGGVAYNNLIYGNQRGLQVFTGSGSAYNNTIYNNINEAIQVYGSASLTYTNNIIYSNGSTLNGSGSSSNNLLTNPNFVNAGSGDFHLQAGSPAIDAGVTLSLFSTDFDGNTRVGPYDIGALEYLSQQQTTQTTAPTGLRIVP